MEISQSTGIKDFSSQPDDQDLKVHIHPMPFQINTNIELQVKSSIKISVEIYDLLGKRIRSISNRFFSAGTHNLLWDSRDETGSLVSSGLYFLRLHTLGKTYNYKIMRVK